MFFVLKAREPKSASSENANKMNILRSQNVKEDRRGSRGGETGEFSPPFSESPSFLFSYPSNIEIIFDFSDIITKIHPLFQNP